MPAIPFLSEPLIGFRAAVRDYAERDIPEILIAHQDDQALAARLGLDRPPSGADLGRWAEEEATQRTLGYLARFTVVVPGADFCAGGVEVDEIDWEHARAELRVWIAPGRRGRGMATDALGLIAPWLIASCGFARVQVIADAGDPAILGAAQGAGFALEGVGRQYFVRDGIRRDGAFLAMTAQDLSA